MLILISDAFDPSLPARLAPFGEVTEDTGRVAEADVVLIRSKTRCSRAYIDAAPNLKLIIRGGVGLDNVDRVYAAERGITVHNTADASSVAVAELAFALMIALPNHVVAGHNGMVRGEWLKKSLKRTELYGKTLGLIGAGRIATEVARRAAAFGMRVIASDPYVETNPHAEMLPLAEVLAQADYLSLHTPLTDDTRGMLNAEALAATRPGVYVINTGRGLCVHGPAMVAALNSGHVRGYATDVWQSDPPPADDPLLAAPNMLMAPHIGASSTENLLRIGDIVVELVGAFVKA